MLSKAVGQAMKNYERGIIGESELYHRLLDLKAQGELTETDKFELKKELVDVLSEEDVEALLK